MASVRQQKPLNGVRIGQTVQVKSKEEILAGLDERGERDSMPFMPEMLKFCGQKFVVDSIAYKTCDTVNITGMHEVKDTVHLSGVRCDGEAHGGCQAGCLIFWKTDWLRPVPGADDGSGDHPGGRGLDGAEHGQSGKPRCTEVRLQEVAHGLYRSTDTQGTSAPVYSCQATELPRATGRGIPMWDVRQYIADVRYGNAPAAKVLRGILIEIFNLAQAASKRLLPRWLRFKGGVKYPFIVGTGRHFPVERLDLEPGDWVRVRSAEEISKTLDKDYQNRGLYFDREMLKYCGQTAQVLRRVDRIIDEKSGRMVKMKTPSVILANAVCTSDFHRNCPRAIYPFWREIWLERVPAPATAASGLTTKAAETKGATL